MQHFLYSLINILNEMSPYILLGFFIAGLLHAFVSQATMGRHLSGHGWRPVVKAALFGIPLPLCSCGVLPTAVSLRRNGASKGATTSFLIATPQTGVDSIAATYSLLGLPFAILRPVAALVGSVAGGMAVDRGSMDQGAENIDTGAEKLKNGFRARFVEALRYGFVDMVASVGKWLLIGLVVAAIITVAVPENLFTGLSSYPLLAMLLMVVVAVPMYICATGSIPIALSLMLKGLSPGTAFVMLMAGPAANFASVLVLSRTMGRRATAIYVASVVVTSICFGLMIDMILPREWFIPAMAGGHDACCSPEHAGIFSSVCSAVLVALMVYAFLFRRNKQHHNHNINHTEMTKKYIVNGMMCVHCKANVERHLKELPGVEAVDVNLDRKTVEITGDVDADTVKDTVERAGYEFGGEA